jgi:hypothetical protein
VSGASDAATPAGPPAVGSLVRTVDRLNPILVREVQQVLNGRAFFTTLGLALVALVVVALVASGGARGGRMQGLAAFVLALQLLAPIVLVAIPLLAFLSMRQEVTAGTVEHLLLSRLTPGAIVRGKLYAAAVQLSLFLSVFAPLIGMTWLLRGVDVPTILQMLGIAAVAGLVCSAFAVMMGAFCRFGAVRALPFLVTAALLVLVSVPIVAGLPYLVASVSGAASRAASSGAPTVLGLLAFPAAVGIVLFGVAASATLSHPNENRSTVFRLLAVALLLAAFGWAAWLDGRTYGSGLLRGHLLEDLAPGIASAFAVVLLPWVHFAVTEAPTLSVRVRTRVPRNPVLALLAVPWLPGGARGVLASVGLAAVALLGARLVPALFAGVAPDADALRGATARWAYVLAWAGMLAFVRCRLPPTARASVFLRLLSPLALVLVVLVPTLVDLLADERRRPWGPLDVLDPFETVPAVVGGTVAGALPLVVGITAFACFLAVPAIVRSVAEVLAASAERRARAR